MVKTPVVFILDWRKLFNLRERQNFSMYIRSFLSGLCIALFLAVMPVQAVDFKKEFLDTLDNRVDLSRWLSRAYGFMPLPSLVTEPAVGAGLATALVFVHRDPQDLGKINAPPPSISAAGGLYTQNKSWAVGAGHLGIWKNGRIRYRGGAGYLSLNLSYYRDALLWPDNRVKTKFNIEGFGTVHEIIFGLFEKKIYAGLTYIFFKNTVRFDKPSVFPEVEPWELDTQISGMGPVLKYDSQDNIFTPNKGIRAQVSYVYYAPFLGSDKETQSLLMYFLGFFPLSETVYPALRLDARFSFGQTPFYLLPFIDLRGIPVMRYQGKSTFLAELETRWDFSFRWSLVGFAGYGMAEPVNENFSRRQSAWNAGAGLRYLIARQMGIRMGFDIARGPEQWAFYLQFGSSWFRY